MHAVAGDHHRATLGGKLHAGRGVLEMRGGAAIVLLDTGAAVIGDDAVGARARDERREQHHLQVTAVDREHRPFVAAVAPARIVVDQLAEAVVVADLGGGDRDLGERILQAELGQFLAGMRQQVDADAERLDLRRGLVDAAGNAGLMQPQPERQPADAGADDDDILIVHGRKLADEFITVMPRESGGIQFLNPIR